MDETWGDILRQVQLEEGANRVARSLASVVLKATVAFYLISIEEEGAEASVVSGRSGKRYTVLLSTYAVTLSFLLH